MSPEDPDQQAYHVVAPSLPGFVFSSGAKHQEFGLRDMAAVDHKIMLALVSQVLGAFFPTLHVS